MPRNFLRRSKSLTSRRGNISTNRDTIPNKKAAKIFKNHQCSFAKNGCEEELEVKDLPDHEKICKFRREASINYVDWIFRIFDSLPDPPPHCTKRVGEEQFF